MNPGSFDEIIIPDDGDDWRLVAVIDSNVLVQSKYMERIMIEARAGHVRLVWSPSIIEEAARYWTWRRLKESGGDFSAEARRRLSVRAHKWSALMSSVFEVQDDRPPHAEMWTDHPTDENDAPIWTAAARSGAAGGCGATVVVTENLKDGPPKDDHGIQSFQGIMYLHPAWFIVLMLMWGEVMERRHVGTIAGEASEQLESVVQRAQLSAPNQEMFPALWEIVEQQNRRFKRLQSQDPPTPRESTDEPG